MADIRDLKSIAEIGNNFLSKRKNPLLFPFEEELFAIELGKFLQQHAYSLFSATDQEIISMLATSHICEPNSNMLKETAELGDEEYAPVAEKCANARAAAHKRADILIKQRLNELDDSDPVKWEYLSRLHVQAKTYEATPTGWAARIASHFENPASTFADSLLRHRSWENEAALQKTCIG